MYMICVVVMDGEMGRRAHKPGGDAGAVSCAEGVAGSGVAVHSGAVPGGDMRVWAGEGLPEVILQPLRRRRQLPPRWLQQGSRPRSRDHRHLRPRLHRLLRHRSQAQRPRLPCSGN